MSGETMLIITLVVIAILVFVGVWFRTRKDKSIPADIPPLLSEKLRRDDYFVTKTENRARRDVYETPGMYEVQFKELPVTRLPERTVTFKAGVDYPEQKKKRNRKFNIFFMVIYVTSMLVITVPDLSTLYALTFTEWGREWARMNPQLTWDMTLKSFGAITMSLLISLLSWQFIIWFYYDVMGGRSLTDRLRERRQSN